MRSHAVLVRCNSCGAARRPSSPACDYCKAPGAPSEPADVVRNAARELRRIARRGHRWLARVEALRGKGVRRLLWLVSFTLPGLIATLWLMAKAPADLRGAVVVVCGLASFAPFFMAEKANTDPPSSWRPPRRQASLDGGCGDCGRRDELSEAVGLCLLCAEAGPVGTAGRDLAEAQLAAMEEQSIDRPLGECPRCGGSAAIDGDRAACAHCAAPLAVDATVDWTLLAAVEQQRDAEREMRAFSVKQARIHRERSEGVRETLSVLGVLGVLAAALAFYLLS